MKTSDLSGAALDWTVLMAEGWQGTTATDNGGTTLWAHKDGKYKNPKQYHPSTNWGIGGPIIEREEIAIAPGYHWEASKEVDVRGLSHYVVERGATPLIAAMRCYVASKLGDEVQIPEEITK